MDRQFDWNWLKALPKGTPLHSLGSSMLQLDADLYRIGIGQYCIGEPSEGNGEPALVSLLWATSDGAARRVYLNEIESDDLKNALPPRELLPLSADCSYLQIAKFLKASGARGISESASYRIMTDGLFIHKSISSNIAVYYFRSPEIVDDEHPYAILWKLKRLG